MCKSSPLDDCIVKDSNEVDFDSSSLDGSLNVQPGFDDQ